MHSYLQKKIYSCKKWVLHKYKEIYDMQASRRKAAWFNMQKPVVDNYALGILVLRSRHLLKVLTSIASQSLTVTDPQPNTIHFDKPTKPNEIKPRVSTNHVRVHAAHNREHGCYNSLHSAEAVHVTHESWLSSDSRILIVPMSTLTHFQGVCQEITTRLFIGFI
jgi:hypothetical protein